MFTVVEHNTPPVSEFFPDDICAVTETVTNTVHVNHLTENEDGSFHFVDFETGFLSADYDPGRVGNECDLALDLRLTVDDGEVEGGDESQRRAELLARFGDRERAARRQVERFAVCAPKSLVRDRRVPVSRADALKAVGLRE